MNNAKTLRKTIEWERQRSLQENQKYQANISYKDGHDKVKNDKDLPEAKEIKKRQQENTEELYRKVLMTWITTIVFSFTQSQTFWSMKSSGLYEALVRTKLVEVMEFLLSYVKILKDDFVKVLPSICQQVWKTQQWPQDWKRPVFISTPKKGSNKECSNYHTITLISHASKVMLKIL